MPIHKKFKIFKCLLCKYPITKNQSSLCCDKCDNWIHLSCSKITIRHFNTLSISESEKYFCKLCENFSCGRCDKAVFNNHNAIQCGSSCGKWFHLKCTNMTLATYKKLGESSDPWFCYNCYQRPFQNIDINELSSFFGHTQIEKSTIKAISRFSLSHNCSICSICHRKINSSKTHKALPCLGCNHLVRRKFSNISLFDLNNNHDKFPHWECLVCYGTKFPFTNITDENLIEYTFNSIKNYPFQFIILTFDHS